MTFTASLPPARAMPEQHGLGKSVFLHLAPGAVLAAGLVLLGPIFRANGLPSLLAVIVVDALVVLPLMIAILLHAKRAAARNPERPPVILYRERIGRLAFLLLTIVLLVWAALAFVLLAPVSDTLRVTVFGWIPGWFDLGGYVMNPGTYSRNVIVTTWVLSLAVTSIAVPIVEELYFRGYLLPRIDRFGAWAPLMNTVLFSAYHLWSPWLTPVRVVATLPFIYVAWLKRSVYLAIAVHVLLNVVGDSILTIPAVFG
jgi:uncharacterized protein